MQGQHLNYILEVHKMRSISKAAEKLKISQPALSAHIKKIEEALGVPIFDRAVKPIQLTEAGQIYIDYMKRQMDLDKELREQISDLECLRRGALTIGGASFFNVSYLPGAVAEYMERYPGIRISVIDGNLPEIIEKALNNELDLFLSPSWNMDERCCYEKFLSEKILICVPPAWSINDRLKDWRIPEEIILEGKLSAWLENKESPYVDFKEFREEPFILLRKEQHIGNMMNRLFERHGFSPEHRIAAEQTMTSYALTLAGAGISLMSESTVMKGHLRDYPAFYLTDLDLCTRDMYIAYPKQKYLSRAGKEFISILKNSLSAFEE